MTEQHKPTVPLRCPPSERYVMPNLQSLRMQIEDMSSEWKRNVSLTFDYRTHSWIAGLASHMVSSIVGPSDALDQLKTKVTELGLNATPTPDSAMFIEELNERYPYMEERRDRPSFIVVLIFLVCVATAAYFIVKALGVE